MAENQSQNSRRVPKVAVGGLVVLSVASITATSILTPLWLDARNNFSDTSVSSCDLLVSTEHIDAYAILFITTCIFFVLFGIILLLTKCICPYLITERETSYDKRVFAVIGASDTVSAICFLYASSGCRTPPYLQALFANFSIPITFIIRFIVLRKRPTCRKTFCAMLVLFAGFTALIPDLVPGLESQQARKDQGGASGVGAILWPVCFFCGFVPLALVSVAFEMAVKSQSPARRSPRDTDLDINIAYCLFWCYLFSLLTLLLLFWTDFVPGFGMTAGVLEFCKTFWFNVKCFLGLDGCRGMINVISAACIVLNLVNKVNSSYFLRYLEGANYLVIITSMQTPLVFLFFTLFDENPLKWHPHAYLSTWLSIAALCIMVPAIYIYHTGAPEIESKNVEPEPALLNVDHEVQTDGSLQSHPDDFDDTSRLLCDTDNTDLNHTDETSRLKRHSVNSHLDDFDDTTRLQRVTNEQQLNDISECPIIICQSVNDHHDTCNFLQDTVDILPVVTHDTSRLMFDTPLDFDDNLGMVVNDNTMGDQQSLESNSSILSFHSCISEDTPHDHPFGSMHAEVPNLSPKSASPDREVSANYENFPNGDIVNFKASRSFDGHHADILEVLNDVRSENLKSESIETMKEDSGFQSSDMVQSRKPFNDISINFNAAKTGSPVVVMKYGSNCLTLQDDIHVDDDIHSGYFQ